MRSWCIRDHPRSRGGNRHAHGIEPLCWGPSPLARGKRNAPIRHGHRTGTIPARAGETRSRCGAGRGCRDHPRSRGGNCCATRGRCWPQGPSPLARGKHVPDAALAVDAGTIPARAGETVAQLAGDAGLRDHPRSRGGNSINETGKYVGKGPSPLARGKRSEGTNRERRLGTIPARAGETTLR